MTSPRTWRLVGVAAFSFGAILYLAHLIDAFSTIHEWWIKMNDVLKENPVAVKIRDARVASANAGGSFGPHRPYNSFEVTVDTIVDKTGDSTVEQCHGRLFIGDREKYDSITDATTGSAQMVSFSSGNDQKVVPFMFFVPVSLWAVHHDARLRIICAGIVTDPFAFQLD